VEKISPPITAIPIGLQSSDPVPLLRASGNIPSIVVAVVIITGHIGDFIRAHLIILIDFLNLIVIS
jgi:hypothetical protein